MNVLIASVQSIVAITQWWLVLSYSQWESQYSVEVRRIAHLHRPWGLKGLAILVTVSAAFWWYRAIRSAEP